MLSRGATLAGALSLLAAWGASARDTSPVRLFVGASQGTDFTARLTPGSGWCSCRTRR